MAEIAMLTRAGLVVGELGRRHRASCRCALCLPSSEWPGLLEVDGFDPGGFEFAELTDATGFNATFHQPQLVEARGGFGMLSGLDRCLPRVSDMIDAELSRYAPLDIRSSVVMRCAGCGEWARAFDRSVSFCFGCLADDRAADGLEFEARAQGVLDLAEYDASRGFARAMESLHRLRGDR